MNLKKHLNKGECVNKHLRATNRKLVKGEVDPHYMLHQYFLLIAEPLYDIIY